MDEVEFNRLFFECPDVVYHLAALFANQNSLDYSETDLLVNELGTLKILQYGQVGNQAGITFTERRKWDTKPRLLASVERAQGLIGDQPHTPFETGFKNTIAWFGDNWALISPDARFGPGMSSTVRPMV